MLNEKRVKHMVKLAMYENKNGAEDFKASAYFKKDYISFNMLWSIIWMTIAYLIVAALFIISKLDTIVTDMSLKVAVTMVAGAVGAYVALLVIFIALSRYFYKKKHARSYHRVKRFKKGLEILQDMYQEERLDG